MNKRNKSTVRCSIVIGQVFPSSPRLSNNHGHDGVREKKKKRKTRRCLFCYPRIVILRVNEEEEK